LLKSSVDGGDLSPPLSRNIMANTQLTNRFFTNSINYDKITFSSSSTRFISGTGNMVMEIPSTEDATLNITGKVNLNGDNLEERLSRIESLLHIPRRDVIMEQKYEKLKLLWKEYTETLEALKSWDTIKESS
jgi:hypothetical protein